MYTTITITTFSKLDLHICHLMIGDLDGSIISETLPYEKGMENLRMLEKIAGHAAELEINPYEASISYKSITIRT